MANSFGQLFRIHTFGESHGKAVGVVVDGCPPGLKLDLEAVQAFLDRRRPGQNHLTSPRQEKDLVRCIAGTDAQGLTLGSPLVLLVENNDTKPADYAAQRDFYRPSHADYTYEMKYGVSALSGGGRASARETIGRVAAAAVAWQWLAQKIPELSVVAWVSSIKDVRCADVDLVHLNQALVDASPVRCPDAKASQAMVQLIEQAKARGDSVGGQIGCVIRGCPAGLGEPVFDKLEADLARAMLSIPACRGFEIGSGFAGTTMFGSEHNDAFVMEQGKVRTATNHSGGIQGGISNGEPIVFQVAFKPVSTISQKQTTVDKQGQPCAITNQGRHDPCVLPRAVAIVEAMAILTVADHWLRQQSLLAGSPLPRK